ncbi:MAG: GDSL family lipase [Ruminococcaceae bacterium]|nr:GDSL family lipase [Oscillospiraceae bacterium]
MKKIKILFQGDSITDAGRDKRNYHDMGDGYPKYAAELISAAYPDNEFEFINLGISGNRTDQLFDRLTADAIDLQPDVISILIGINDIWHRHLKERIATTDAQIETNYRAILERIKNETGAKIIMIAPYILDFDNEMRQSMRRDFVTVLPIIKKLADEFADVYIPLNEIFAEALKTQPAPLHYSSDGVHPNVNGSRFIGEQYAKYAAPLIAEL